MEFEYIKGITFAPFAERGALSQEKAKESLRVMKERTGADTVLLLREACRKLRSRWKSVMIRNIRCLTWS